MGNCIQTHRQEIKRARGLWNEPWHHIPGDEGLVANPVEIPGILLALEACFIDKKGDYTPHPHSHPGFLTLPAEIIGRTLSFLDAAGVEAMTKTCKALRQAAQPAFRALVLKDMPWLWEVVQDNNAYPDSRDWSPTWDPLCPPGLEPPELPVGLETAEDEAARWAEIVAEDPEMEAAGDAAKLLNRQRREAIMAPYRSKQEASFDEWRRFRAGVEAWISCTKTTVGHLHCHEGNTDWRRIYWLCNPTTSPLPGLRNRSRIWEYCEHILDCIGVARESGEIDKRRGAPYEKLTDLDLSTDIYVDDIF
jgi:hypothetical protein